MTRRACILIAALAAAAPAVAAEFVVAPGDGEIVFESKAPMESFEGRSDRVSGRVSADLDDLLAPVDVRVELDMASLDTGLGLRNRHMRENHLETDRFPVAVFRATTVLAAEPTALVPGGRAAITLKGELDLHGVVRTLVCDADLELAADGVLRVRVAFPVSLADHGIDRPKFLLLKLADEQKVRADLTARPAGGAR